MQEVKGTDLETKKLSLFVCFKPFPPVLYWRLFSGFFLSSASLSLSLPSSCTFFFPVLQMLYAEKWKQRPKGQSLLVYGFSFFSCFSCSFFSSSTACLPELTTTQGWRKENSLCSLRFFYSLPLLRFSYLSFAVPLLCCPSVLFFRFFSPPILGH